MTIDDCLVVLGPRGGSKGLLLRGLAAIKTIVNDSIVSDSIPKPRRKLAATRNLRGAQRNGTLELKARVEWRNETSSDWIQEKVTCDAAYGNERVPAYLFLPKNSPPPYQTVIYFPGSGSVSQPSSKDLDRYPEFVYLLSFVVNNGRAVLYPVYKGTFERRDEALAAIHGGANTRQYTEYMVQLVKDFGRCIDYLETRPDIDT